MAASALPLCTLAPQAFAQSGVSPFSPALTDPRQAQRFARPPDGVTRATQPGADPAPRIPSGASETGFDSTGSIGKKKKAKRKPGAPHPARLPPPPPPGPPQKTYGQVGAPQAAARKSYAEAYVTPDTTPRRPPVPLKDPYEPLGVPVGSVLFKPAVEITRGFDSNPSRAQNGSSSPYTVVAPELQVRSQWSRHEWNATLRGSYSAYDKDSSLNRPMIDGKTAGRFDLLRDTSLVTEGRLFVSTDNPGSPNIQVGLARLPVYVSYGSTVGLVQRFNRLELTAKGGLDSTRFQDSELTDGTMSSNRDRDYNQYSGQARASYEVMPGIRPFVELGADVRRHAVSVDRNGFQRDSRAWSPKAGTTFELTRILTGEVSVGYHMRRYEDPALQELRGLIFDASLVWQATGLTSATLTASSRAGESVVAGVSGSLNRDVGVQIDHAFRRWLIGTLKFGYGQDMYIGNERTDTRTSLGAALTYKFNREVSMKGEYRYDTRRSNVQGVDYNASTFLFGLKLQR